MQTNIQDYPVLLKIINFIKKHYFKIVAILMIALSVCVVYGLTPTQNELINRQMNINGERWKELQEEKEILNEKLNKIKKEQEVLHLQNEAFRINF